MVGLNFLVEDRRQVVSLNLSEFLCILLSRKFVLRSNWADEISTTALTKAFIIENSPASTGSAFHTVASYCSKWAVAAFTQEEVVRVVPEILVFIAVITGSIGCQSATSWARNALAFHISIQTGAFLLRNSHHDLSLLVVSICSANHHRILLTLNEV